MNRKPHYVREWRRYRCLTVNGLAKEAGVSASMVSKLERRLVNYTQPMLERLSGPLQVTPAWLVAINPFDPDQSIEFMVALLHMHLKQR